MKEAILWYYNLVGGLEYFFIPHNFVWVLVFDSVSHGGDWNIFYFSIYWEFHKPNCYSLHHFSEGLVETTNQ